jgi:hypothetical protein
MVFNQRAERAAISVRCEPDRCYSAIELESSSRRMRRKFRHGTNQAEFAGRRATMCYKWEWFQWRRAAETREKREQSKTVTEHTPT